MIVYHYADSLVSGSTSFSASRHMETLLNVLARSRSTTLMAIQVKQTCAWVSRNLCLDALATETAHVLLDILFVKTIDCRRLVTALK